MLIKIIAIILSNRLAPRSSSPGCPFFWREIWEAIFLTGKRRYMPRAEDARKGVVTKFSITLETIEKHHCVLSKV